MHFTSSFLLSLLLAPLVAHANAGSPKEPSPPRGKPKDTRPNVIFILTDDQDLHLNSLDYLPYVNKHITKKGTLFKKHYCTIAICCPSRVNLWTGRAAHNTNITDVGQPFGGYPRIVEEKLLDNYLFTWLEKAGYANYYVGKLFNGHTITNYNNPYPKGFTGTVSKHFL